MNFLISYTVLLIVLIANVYGRIVNFSLLTFGKDATVTFNGKTLEMLSVDDYSGVKSISAICPDEEF
eukprot:jgi/Orpsp1_1/1178116/evm.model.c7180000064110.1